MGDYNTSMWQKSLIGGVMVSVLANGPKVCGFKPGRGDVFLRTTKIRSKFNVFHTE
jgi:hypothetical protein